MICPRCGFEQPDAVECGRCGIVVERFRPAPARPLPAPAAVREEVRETPASSRRSLLPGLFVVLAVAGLFAAGYVRLQGPRQDPLATTLKASKRRPQAEEPVTDEGPPWRARANRSAASPVESPWSGPSPGAADPHAAVPAGGDGDPFPLPTPTIDLASLYPTPVPRKPSGSWYSGASGFEQAVEEQKATRAALFVYFHTSWCGFCRRVDSDYLPSPEMQGFLSEVVKVSVDAEGGDAERRLASRYGVNGFPAIFVQRAGGGAQRVHPFHEGGDATPSEFAATCRQASR